MDRSNSRGCEPLIAPHSNHEPLRQCVQTSPRLVNRREALYQTGLGIGGVALTWLLSQDQPSSGAETRFAQGLTRRPPHFAPSAKSVIFLFMEGGPSHVDLFDPKPMLAKYDGKRAPFAVDQRSINGSRRLMASPFRFGRHGGSGLEVSELLPHLSRCVDDIAVVRSGTSTRFDHDNAQLLFHSGRGIPGFPTMGAWVSYGLGTCNQNLPAYIAMGGENRPWSWTSGWLPPIHQGTLLNTEGTPILDLQRPDSVTPREQKRFLQFVRALNNEHFKRRSDELELEARIRNFELAAHMQKTAMDQVSIENEPKYIKQSYGINAESTREVGLQCLVARRLIEAGVRFVQINVTGWDHHKQLKKRLIKSCRATDQPVAALLVDLKQRGLLDETVILWSGEFGRLPTVEGNQGRDHGPQGFSLWLAGGGIRGGTVFGATDDFGYRAVNQPITQSHLHATILYLLGLDYERLIYPYEGRDETLIGVEQARVLKELIA